MSSPCRRIWINSESLPIGRAPPGRSPIYPVHPATPLKRQFGRFTGPLYSCPGPLWINYRAGVSRFPGRRPRERISPNISSGGNVPPSVGGQLPAPPNMPSFVTPIDNMRHPPGSSCALSGYVPLNIDVFGPALHGMHLAKHHGRITGPLSFARRTPRGWPYGQREKGIRLHIEGTVIPCNGRLQTLAPLYHLPH